MTFLLIAFLLGYLVGLIQAKLQKQLMTQHQELAQQEIACQQTRQLILSLELMTDLLQERQLLQRQLSELRVQHEKTLAALN